MIESVTVGHFLKNRDTLKVGLFGVGIQLTQVCMLLLCGKETLIAEVALSESAHVVAVRSKFDHCGVATC